MGAAKSLHPGKIVTTFILGSQHLYDWVHDNPMVEMHPVDYTNDTSIIRRNTRMTAINSALQVDLSGQACADSIRTRLYSGVGGQMDFMRGAALSSGRKGDHRPAIHCRSGTLSRIVPVLMEGAGVRTTRAHVQYVVTEYGTAYVHGKSIRERAQALIGVANPAFRDGLWEWAREQRNAICSLTPLLAEHHVSASSGILLQPMPQIRSRR
jgi:4-hydroxybutyrate CoA-transferase